MAATAHSSSAGAQDSGAGLDAQLVIEKHLSQGFRLVAPIGWLLSAVTNADGDVEYFVAGTDSTIWNVFPDATSDTGYSAATTNVPNEGSSAFALIADGSLVAISTSSAFDEKNTITYATRYPGQPWSGATSEKVPIVNHWYHSEQWYAEGVEARRFDDGTVFVVAVCGSENTGWIYQAWWKSWQSGAGVNESFNTQPVAGGPFPDDLMNGHNVRITGRSSADAGITVLNHVPVQALFSGSSATSLSTPSFATLASAYTYDPDGALRIFYISSADGNAYTVVDGDAQATPTALSSGGLFTLNLNCVQAIVDSNGITHAFALGGPVVGGSLVGVLNHWSSDAASATGFTSIDTLFDNCSAYSIAVNGTGAVEVVVQANSPKQIVRLVQGSPRRDANGNIVGPGTWEQTVIEIDGSNDNVETMSVYTTEVWVNDSSGAPVIGQAVTITAHDVTEVLVNGVEHLMLPTRPLQVATNSAGMFTVVQPTDQLGAVSFDVSIVGTTTTGPLVIDPGADVQATLDDLATNAAAQQSLKVSVPQAAQLDTDSFADLIKGIGDVMSVDTDSSAVRPLLTRRGARAGVHLRTGGTPGTRIGLGPITASAFTLAFDAGRVRHAPVSDSDAATIRAGWLADGAQQWSGTFSDLARAMAAGGATVGGEPDPSPPVTFVLTPSMGPAAASGGHWWSVAINFVMDGISWLADLVISCLADALDAVMSFFASIKAFFADLFSWLGYLFNWPDILRTAAAVNYIITQHLALLTDVTAALQQRVTSGLVSAKAEAAAWFTSLQARFGPMGSIASVGDLGEQAAKASGGQGLSGLSNNVVVNGMLDHGSAAQPISISTASPADDDDTTDMWAAVKAAGIAQQADLQIVINGLNTDCTQPTATLDTLVQTAVGSILTLLEQAVQAVLGGAQVVADALFQVIQWALKKTTDFLTASVDIPLVTKLYTTVIAPGQPLTIVGLSSLMVAIPATAIVKLVTSQAPFPIDDSMPPSDDSLHQFTSSFSAATMRQRIGLSSSDTPRLDKPDDLSPRSAAPASAMSQPVADVVGVDPRSALIIGVLAGVSSVLCGVCSAITDTEPPLSAGPLPVSPTPASTFYGIVGTAAVFFDVTSTALSCPAVFEAEDAELSSSEVVLWLFSATGTVFDLGTVLFTESRRARGDALRDPVAVIWSLFGVVHLGVIAMCMLELGAADADVVPEFVSAFAEACQVCFTTTAAAASDDLSIAFGAVLDLFAGVCSGAFTITAAIADYEGHAPSVRGALG